MSEDLNKQAQEILKIAEKHGVEQNFFFITTFKRYMHLLKTLEELEKVMNAGNIIVEKVYNKGIKNTYVHPAVSAYNKTSSEANKTVSTLVSIILKMRNREDDDDSDPLLEFLSGRKDSIE